ncbi:MAG: hypothetical protein JO215_06805 [Ktedonobacteraceae bacterium]|nr:hypothetical protein [Ktedonobacteraceae bacterium]
MKMHGSIHRGHDEPGPISWWSWRPGIRPQNALLIGIPFTCIPLLMTLLGLVTLIAGIEDSRSSPLLVPGIVRHRSAGTTTSPPQLTIHLQGPKNIPSDVTLPVSNNTFQQVGMNAGVTVNYSPHLHFAYALDYTGKHYPLPGTTAAGNPVGSVALLLVGLLLLPYPALLSHWGWQDLLVERYRREKLARMTARVVDKRATTRTRTARPGLTGRGTRPWYGLALLRIDQDTKPRIYTFSVNEEIYRRVQHNTHVNIVYSPHLHYVYSIEQGDQDKNCAPTPL